MFGKASFSAFLVTYCSLLGGSLVFAQYGGGMGTIDDPYLIYTAEQFNTIGLHPEDWYKNFKLMANLDLSGLDGRKGRPALNIIAPDVDSREGFQGTAFTGVFDGNDHVLSHLTVTGTGYLGLFGQLGPRGEIRALMLADVDLSCYGPGPTGGLAASVEGGRVAYCHSGGHVQGSGRWVGGLVGINDGEVVGCSSRAHVTPWAGGGGLVGQNFGSLVNCHATGRITEGRTAGGLVGSNSGLVTGCYVRSAVSGRDVLGGLVGANAGRVIRCYSTAKVNGTGWDIGGLVGLSGKGAVVNRCYSLGSVYGTGHVGGLVGFNEGGRIEDCHSRGDVTGAGPAGGFVGGNWGDLIHCYSSGAVVSDQSAGGFTGEGWVQGTVVTGCFWDTQTSGLAASADGTGLSTSQMHDIDTYLTAGWDFIDETENGTEEIWCMAEGPAYPQLVWELGASSPDPPNGARDVGLSMRLSWLRTRETLFHDVYVGRNADDVVNATPDSAGVYRGRQPGPLSTYDPEGLEWGRTYYWRIDEVDETSPGGVRKGDVWRFTTIPLFWPIEDVVATTNATSVKGTGPDNTINGSGLDDEDQHSTSTADMWIAVADGADPLYIQYEFDKVYKLHEMLVWNCNGQFESSLGFGIEDVTVAYSENGMDWTTLGDVVLNQAIGWNTYTYNTTIDFQGLTARYVRLTIHSHYGAYQQFGLSEVRFLYIPVWAHDPWPASGASEASVTPLLTWRPGREAVWHEVYLSGDPTTLGNEETLVDRTRYTTVEPGPLDLDTTYYWKVHEANEAQAVGLWEGDIWRFTTQEFIVIDDFESYTDDADAGEAIWQTWIDGWETETNGSIVGYIDWFDWWTPAHSGSYSMPFDYDNSGPAHYSEAHRTWDVPQDWTRHGADTLRLFIWGKAPDFYEGPDGTILMNGRGSISSSPEQFRFVHKRLAGDGSMTVRIDCIGDAYETEACVMIRESLDVDSPHVCVGLSSLQALLFQYRLVAGEARHQVWLGDLTAPCWVKLTRVDNVFIAQWSLDGLTWRYVTDDVAASVVEIPTAGEVLIGLAVAGSNLGEVEFMGLVSAGDITGPWQMGELGQSSQPSGNALETLYVAIQDSTGKPVMVSHPDPTVVGRGTWQQWLIPFGAFGDVNFDRVRTMYIGLGDRDNPQPGGAGRLFIDDIQLLNRLP